MIAFNKSLLQHIFRVKIISCQQKGRTHSRLFVSLKKLLKGPFLALLKQQGLIDPDIFISQQSRLAEQIRAAKQEKAKLLDTEEDTTLRDTQDLLDTLESGSDILDALDGDLFGELVEKVIVESGEKVRFRLKNGLELAETIERTVR